TGTGALFYMIGALSQYGKLGMTCIGNSPGEAQDIFRRTVAALDNEAEGDSHGELAPIFDRYLAME
ncbi:MAG: peptide ligase PGM1-related protein, partial [Gammaproteobacteria bacterium]|nr:peptide ligase PGM1-related protein [Gammaproteobacteria bacterium]